MFWHEELCPCLSSHDLLPLGCSLPLVAELSENSLSHVAQLVKIFFNYCKNSVSWKSATMVSINI